MEYSKLISVTGKPGLFELISSKTDGALVKSIDDKSITFVSNRIHNFSHLESIEVYTEAENVNLIDIFKAMQDSTEALPNEKDVKATKQYFQKVFPTMDFDRVYDSDRKKMVKWYNLITLNKIALKLSSEITEHSDDESSSS